jgi:uncharacterized membrane protein
MGPFYPWFHYLHVAAAFWLAAGIFASSVVRAQGKHSSETAARGLAARLLWRLHVVFTLPGLVVAGFLGFYLVAAGGFRFGDTWVLAAALLYLLMFLSTLFAVTPGLARQRTAATPLTEKLSGIASDVNALILLVLAWLMVVKP